MTNIAFKKKTICKTRLELANNYKKLKSLSKLLNNKVKQKKIMINRPNIEI